MKLFVQIPPTLKMRLSVNSVDFVPFKVYYITSPTCGQARLANAKMLVCTKILKSN